MLKTLRRWARQRRASDMLLTAAMAQSRLPIFYERYAVADTIDGRFDLLALHASLLIDRLAEQGETALSQELTEGLFAQFNSALREQGAGDMGIGRRMNKMADALFGRLKAYREAADAELLAQAFIRNVFRGDEARLEAARALAIYAVAARARLAASDLSDGQCDFGAPREP